MRLPEYESLSKSQVDIYRDKIEGNMLVSGPPGSGKTILALHRAAKLKAEYKEDAVTLLMFNNTLSAYSKQGTSSTSLDLDNITITTMTKWFKWNWYYKWTEYDKYNRNPDVVWPFKWIKSKNNKKIEVPDYEEIIKQIHILDKAKISKLNWGHLIIDEGQDFSEDLYQVFIEAQYRLNENNIQNITISVFADDNQTITEHNSSVQQIKLAMEMKRDDTRHYRIFENYRNSKEIYNFSKHFQVTGSNSTLQPQLETGDIPWVMFREAIDEYYDIIVRVAENGNKAVGVICLRYSKDVMDAITGLSSRVKNSQVQGYSSSSKTYNRADKINFDKGGSITVLHSQSAKGLEFDVVFVLNTEALKVDNEHAFDKYKKLYVVNTRAREQLRLCFLYNKLPSSLGLLPKGRIDKDFRIQTNIAEVNNEIKNFDGWRRSPEECAQEARVKIVNEIKTRYANYPIDVKKIVAIIKSMKKDVSEKYTINDNSLESLAWFIVEMKMEGILEKIIDKLIEGPLDE